MKQQIMRILVVGVVVTALAGCANQSLKEARLAYDEGKYMEASQKAKAALKENDQSAEALYIRGMAAVELKDYIMGRELLKKASEFYGTDTEEGVQLLRQLALAHFYLKDVEQAEVIFNEYMAIKEKDGRILQEEDYFWAGAIADVAMKDEQRDQYWSKLSTEFKKSKGIN